MTMTWSRAVVNVPSAISPRSQSVIGQRSIPRTGSAVGFHAPVGVSSFRDGLSERLARFRHEITALRDEFPAAFREFTPAFDRRGRSLESVLHTLANHLARLAPADRRVQQGDR